MNKLLLNKRVLLLFMTLLSIQVYSQGEPSSEFNFLENKDKMVEVPQSPEVAAFEKYGNLPVNFYAGAPEISIPVFTHKGKEMSLPISLTYDATGIKVNQIATNVGLGWNLNFGGVVSREIKHLPDDLYDFIPQDGDYYGHELISAATTTRNYINIIRTTPGLTSIFNNIPYNSHDTAQKMEELYRKYKEDKIDLQPDEFNFNVNGLSGKIFINYDDNTAYCVTDPNIKASFTTANNNNRYYINSWTITDAGGTVYTFENYELTKAIHREENPSLWDDQFREYIREYSSSWFLTRIDSPNSLDTYTFHYTTPMYWEDNYLIKNPVNTAVAKRVGTNLYQVNSNFPYDNDYQIKQFQLSEIRYHSTIIFSTETAYRDDLISMNNGEKMKRFAKLKSHNSFGQVVQTMELQHSYFKNSTNQTNDWENSRLKLDGILIYNANANDPKKYEFVYENPDNMPKITSNAVDFWGYYNGQNGNAHLIVKKDVNMNTQYFNWANRNPSFYYAKTGVLTSITYPTGGKTTFHYETHQGFGTSHPDAVNGIVGGLRIKKQESETMDTGDTQKITKLYYYGDAKDLPNPASPASNYIPSAIIHQPLQFYKQKSFESHGDPLDPLGPETNKTFFLSQNNYIQAPNAVAYTHVSEIELISGALHGFTVYEFYNDPINIYTTQDIPFINEKPSNGKTRKISIYDKYKDLQKESINTYNNMEEVVGHDNGHGITFIEQWVAPNIGGDKGCPELAGGVFRITLLPQNDVCGGPGGPYDYYGKPYDYYSITPYNYLTFFWSKHLESIEKVYYNGNPTPVTTTTTNDYNDKRFISEVNKTLSNGETTKTEVFYPQDLVNQGEPDNDNLLNLKNRNSISSPVKVLNYKNGNLIGTQRKFFPTTGGGGWPGTGSNAILPIKISASKAQLDLEDKVIFHEYENGNPVRISYADAPQKYYIWGYNNQLMVGQIENWPDNPSPNALAKITEIKNISNNVNTTISQLHTKFQELRGLLPHAQVTGFTHKPGVGVSSISDAKGDVIYYHYDTSNRLEYVKDKDGNRLSENEYNYRVNN